MKRKKPPPPPLPPAKQAEARAVGARLEAAMDFREVQIGQLAKTLGKSRNTVSNHLKPKPWHKGASGKTRRIYERALRLPPLCLDSGSPQELVGLLQNAPQRVTQPPSAPFPRPPQDFEGTMAFIRSQLEGYQMRGKTLTAQQVIIWLDDLEGAATSAAASPTLGVGPLGVPERGAGSGSR